MVFLTEITLNNFKSFKGEHRVEKMLPFAAVVGPNGSGKSNFTDAIGFVLGLPLNKLRVAKISQLVYRSINGESPNEMSVKAVLRANNGTETLFQRLVTGTVREYRINDDTVPREVYVNELIKMHVNPLVNDFAIFQDNIETILEQTPKERTAMIDKVSESGLLAAEYNRLSASIAQHSKELEHFVTKKKIILSTIRTMKYLERNGMEYKDLEKEYRTAREKLMLFDLFCVERELADSISNIEPISLEISELEKKKTELDETLAINIQRLKEIKAEMEEIEREVAEIEIKAVEFSKATSELKAAIEYAESCVNSYRESYDGALNASKVCDTTIAELEEALSFVEKKKSEHCHRYSETLIGTLQLGDSLTNYYEHLKQRYLEICAADEQKLASVERSCQFFKNTLEFSNRKMNEAKDALQRQLNFHQDTKKRGDRLEERRDEMRRELEELSQFYHKLSSEFRAFKEHEDKLVEEIDEIGKVDFDHEEVREMRKKANIVANLKENFDGVFDRLGNMYEPIHHRWIIAVNKVIGHHRNSIVVDTMTTGIACTKYLREQRLAVETFLPLDSLVVKPLNKHLRTVYEGTNVKLLYDVIKFSPPEISKVLLYAIGNTLVAETTEDASKIAFDGEKRYDCVARTEGILYRRSGLISGGTSSRNTIGRYNSEEQAMSQLRKESLIARLREIRWDAPTEQKLIETKAAVERLEIRIKYLEDDCKKARNELIEIERATWELENAFDTAQHQRDNDAEALRSVSTEIEALKSNIRVKEKEIFAEFCERVGVDDIHQYENGHQVYQETLQDFDNQIDRIKKQLDYEISRKPKLTVKVEKLKEKLDEAEAKLRAANKELIIYTSNSEAEELFNKIPQLEAIYRNLKKSSENFTNEITRLRDQLHVVSKMHLSREGKINRLKIAIQKAKEKRRDILNEAKINDVKIPMVNVSPSGGSQTRESTDSSYNAVGSVAESSEAHDDEANIKIDYRKLPKVLLDGYCKDAEKIRHELATLVDEVSSTMRNIPNPNVMVSQELMDLAEKKNEMDRAIKKTNKTLRAIRDEFDDIKQERYTRFLKVFDRMQNHIDAIYKKLTGSESAQSFLLPENPEEPYLGGIYYNCIPPGKRYCGISDLSGGEKALASLSLLFALQSLESPPCQIFDEIDAPLDNRNVKKLADYVTSVKETQQTIIVSHNEKLIAGADQLIGVASKKAADGIQSKIFTLNTSLYRKK